MGELHIAVEAGDLASVVSSINRGASLEEEDEFGDTPLRTAATYGHFEIVKTLVENGADVNSHDDDEWITALMCACGNGHIEIAMFLIDQGADVNAEDDYEVTALMCAAERGHADVVRLLLENGAHAERRDDRKMTALDLAKESGHAAVVRILRRRSMSSVSKWLRVVRRRATRFCRRLLRRRS